MKNTYFTVGPSQLFPTLEQHIHEAIEQQIGSMSHRGKAFENIFSSTVLQLKTLLSIPEDYFIFFVSSGTEAMERTIENVVEKESFHFVNGAFSQRLFDTAIELGKHAQKIEAPLGEGFDLTSMQKGVAGEEGLPGARTELREGALTGGKRPTGPRIPQETELLCFTHNETSTGVMLPSKEIAMIKKHHPDKLIAIDMVSSVPYGNIDFSFADIVFFSVQKLFGLPAGLGVMVVSPQALEKAKYLQKKGVSIGSYHNFPTLKFYAEKNQTPETPSVLHLYLLNKILEDLLAIGINRIRKQTDEKATLLYDFFDTHQKWNAFVKEKTFRSPTVIVADVGEDQTALMEQLKTHGMILGKGYGTYKDTQIRIANFPSLSKKDIENLISLLHNYT